jgi:hypothetical protein
VPRRIPGRNERRRWKRTAMEQVVTAVTSLHGVEATMAYKILSMPSNFTVYWMGTCECPSLTGGRPSCLKPMQQARGQSRSLNAGQHPDNQVWSGE